MHEIHLGDIDFLKFVEVGDVLTARCIGHGKQKDPVIRVENGYNVFVSGPGTENVKTGQVIVVKITCVTERCGYGELVTTGDFPATCEAQ
jgi:predicted RNA-binding protein with TRAM domain